MMKILYLGVYRDGTGYGNSAIDYIRALHAAGADVVCRPIKLNQARPKVPDIITELEAKPHDESYDAVIQDILPTHFDYNGRIPLNIGRYCTETDRVHPAWVDKINTMDKAIVYNDESLRVSQDSGVTIPIHAVPPACDTSKYQRMYQPLSIRDQMRDRFAFYFIGEYNRRKNLLGLLQAFHLEFHPDEPVELVLKLSCPMPIRSEAERIAFDQEVANYIAGIKGMMALYDNVDKYKQEIVLTNSMLEEEIMRLHSSCDCFVCPSHGEAWCIPAFDAMAFGKTPIVSNTGGFLSYINMMNGFLITGTTVPVFGMDKAGISSREQWFQPDIDHLRSAMRIAFKNKQVRQTKAKNGIKDAYNFSHAVVGKQLLEVLQ